MKPTTRAVLRSLVGPAIALVLVLSVTGAWATRWIWLATADTVRVSATSTGDEILPGVGPIPGDVIVEFRDDRGMLRSADVATNDDLPVGTPVEVTYVATRPSQARLSGSGDALDRGAGLAGGAILLVMGWAVVAMLRGRRAAAATHAIRKAPGRPALATLAADPAGAPVLLLADPQVVPTRIFALSLTTPLPARAPASFPDDQAATVVVHGRLADDEVVVVELLHPTATVLEADGPLRHADHDDLLLILDSAGHLARHLAPD